MPTSSERLTARAFAYEHAGTDLLHWAEKLDDPMEVEEYERVANKLMGEYYRLNELAMERLEKEKELEHRRKPK